MRITSAPLTGEKGTTKGQTPNADTKSSSSAHNHIMSNVGDGNPFEVKIMPPWYKLAYIMKVGCRSKEKKKGNICVPRPGCYIKISDNANEMTKAGIKAAGTQSCKDRVEKALSAVEGDESGEKCKEHAEKWDNDCGVNIGTFGYEFIG